MDRPGQERQRTRSSFSVRSDKSGSSRHSKTKLDLKETPEEKHKRKLSVSGKANPLAAMREAQPVAAALEAPTIGSLRSIRPVDAYGNAIAEPDLANPTRSRWERPLDTIRSFEAAIDTGHRKRAGQRPGLAPQSESGNGYGNQSRRNSYFGDQHSSQYSQGQPSPGYFNNGNGGAGGYGYGRGPSRMPPQRMQGNRRQNSEPFPVRHYQSNENMYPNPGYQRSGDTVNTGYTNSSSEPWANSTDPSSEDSSVDRISAAPKPQYDNGEQYGYSGYGGPSNRPIMEEGAPLSGYGYNQPNQGNQAQASNNGAAAAPPPVPPHEYNGTARPARARNTLSKTMSASAVVTNGHGALPPLPPAKDAANGAMGQTGRPDLGQKRKSWLQRTFSRSGK